MRILIAHDDGIYIPGLFALAEVASEFGEVRIVAPDVEQSSMGHAISAHRPLAYKRTAIGKFEAYRVNGTPVIKTSSYEKNTPLFDIDSIICLFNNGL